MVPCWEGGAPQTVGLLLLVTTPKPQFFTLSIAPDREKFLLYFLIREATLPPNVVPPNSDNDSAVNKSDEESKLHSVFWARKIFERIFN